MIALGGAIHVACFHHSCFSMGVCRCLLEDVSVWEHATSFLRRGCGEIVHKSHIQIAVRNHAALVEFFPVDVSEIA